jgi:hypothetical protein
MSSSIPAVTQTSIISQNKLNNAETIWIDDHTAEIIEAKPFQALLQGERGMLILYYITKALKHGYTWSSVDSLNIMLMRLSQDSNDPFMTEVASKNISPEGFSILIDYSKHASTSNAKLVKNLADNQNPAAILGWYLSIKPEDTDTETFMEETPEIITWLNKNPAYNQYFDLVWVTISQNVLASPMSLKRVLQESSTRNPFLLLFESSPEMAERVMGFFTYNLDQVAAYSIAPQLVSYLIEQSLEKPNLLAMLRDWDQDVIDRVPMKPNIRQQVIGEPKKPEIGEDEEEDIHDWAFEDFEFASNSSWYKRARARKTIL